MLIDSLSKSFSLPHFSPKNQKPPTLSHQGFIRINLAVTYSHMGISHTTIGITAFHFWVRYGIRWVHRIIAAKNRSMIFFSFSLISFFLFLCLLQTKTSWLSTFSSLSFLLTVTLTHHARLGFPKTLERCMAKPLGQLVCVSSMYHYTYTPHLSTS